MSGAYVSFTITLSMHAMSVGEWDKVSALLLFPMGFVMLILMGNDLATGNFALLPMAYLDGKREDKDKRVSIVDVLINWLIVYSGNFIGALLFLFLYWSGNTHFGARDSSKYEAFKTVLCSVADSKIVEYIENGAAGWFASVFNGILCNWMVCMGVLLSFSSRSTIGMAI